MSGIDMLLITSAWRGLYGEWHNLPVPQSDARLSITANIVPYARELGVPIAFYSKEDPPNFSKFSGLAQLADHVFTSAVESIPKYRAIVRDRVSVDVLPFAVNYQYHNPLGSMRHAGREYMFAGSWFSHKYGERRAAAQKIFDGVVESGAELVIIDRNLELDPARFANVDQYSFPDRYLPYLHGPIAHERLLLLQRLLPVGINLNSVISSQTMFANRAIEMQAMGTAIFSNYNAGLNTQFPHISMPDSRLDIVEMIHSADQSSIREAQVAGIRSAFTSNTAFDRIDTIIAAVGLSRERSKRRVFVGGLPENCLSKFFEMQTYAGVMEYVPNVRLADVRGGANGDVFVDVGGRTDFGPNLVQDVVNAFRYAATDKVSVRPVSSSASLYERCSDPKEVPDGFVASWVDPELTVLTAADLQGSTLTIASDLKRDSADVIQVASQKPELTVVIPVYNNGTHLVHKCFESLRRSDVFSNSEILLVDDGSSDWETVSIVDRLAAEYTNVRLFRFPEGGSGSASRPRNRGLELTRTPFVTYLDPDNEQTNGGYGKLLRMMKSAPYDFCIGNMIRHKDKRVVVRNSGILNQVVDNDGWLKDHALSLTNYQPMSIQAMVARTDWLKSLGITQPVGAVGQDSYFFQQMMYYARRIGVTAEPIHTYYAAVSSSTVNSVGPSFYEKYIPLERDRSSWLERVGLLEDYANRRLEPYFKGWFVKKLELVPERERGRCLDLIRRLMAFYGDEYWSDPELREIYSEAVNA